ncbi:ribosomal RNA-processing protein 8 [Lucilia cuprina]|uniref:ribosomal RNA-processing protein 8 n=1 Tax=Lucilia cuprina TaxID=7375 RepID=UPI001F0624F7|nr:ribosomal RNA-processing protein 8 [Lucilia cuprina]
MKFFVPSAFDKSTEAVKFKPTQLAIEQSSSKIEKNKKNKKKKSKKANEHESVPHKGKGPLAPHLLESDDDVMPDTNKVKKGKVEKKKNNKKQQKQKLKPSPALSKAIQETIALAKNDPNDNDDAMEDDETPTATAPANSFEAKLKEQLMGGRFRFLNEQLYTMNSKKAENLFKQDPEAFKAYHDGYRHQVEKWPLNPLDRIIKMIKKLPKSLEICDFGCGEGKLAKSVPHKVISMDLVSCRDDIIACDMAETPLTTQSLDVAVYCLSLMGTNLKDYLLEANRVLKMDGLIYIAEIQSRFDNVKDFVKKLDTFGFQLIRQDVGQKVFYFFQFKKVRNVGKVANVPQLALKPCLYRKR